MTILIKYKHHLQLKALFQLSLNPLIAFEGLFYLFRVFIFHKIKLRAVLCFSFFYFERVSELLKIFTTFRKQP